MAFFYRYWESIGIVISILVLGFFVQPWVRNTNKEEIFQNFVSKCAGDQRCELKIKNAYKPCYRESWEKLRGVSSVGLNQVKFLECINARTGQNFTW